MMEDWNDGRMVSNPQFYPEHSRRAAIENSQSLLLPGKNPDYKPGKPVVRQAACIYQ